MLLSLVACGGDETTPSTSNDNSSVNEETTDNSTNEDKVETQIVFEEIIVVDNEECSIKITDIDSENIFGFTLKAHLENEIGSEKL